MHRPEWKLSLVGHGDASTAPGVDASIDKLEAGLKALFEIKVRGRIGEHLLLKDMKMLNKIVTLTDKGILYEADPRDAELLVRNMSVTNSVATPGGKDGDLENQAPKDQKAAQVASAMEGKWLEPMATEIAAVGQQKGPDNIHSHHAHNPTHTTSHTRFSDWLRA